MRAVIQRVSEASVTIDNKVQASIDKGFVVLLGIETDDGEEDLDYLVKKISGLRVFSDNEGKMNLSIGQIDGQFLVISQFTLHASTKKGNRPSFIRAARPEQATLLYEKFKMLLHFASKVEVKSGIFAADMDVSLVNNGPVTIIIDSKNRE